jgi:para-aminobenzoate synthetase / 4-amino-4-deoxychorismate lyase
MTRWHSPPAEIYAVVEHSPATVLLESAPPPPAGSEPSGSPTPSRLFIAPLRVLIANNSAELSTLFTEIERAVASGLYAAGYFSYECGAFFEPAAALINPPVQSPTHPLAWFGIYQRPYTFDHETGAFVGGDPPFLARFRTADAAEIPPQPNPACALTLTEQQYAQRIQTIHRWIRSGDVYQLNFTLPIQVHAPGSSAALYSRLRARQPAPYGAFLHTQPNHRILSFSPELFFRVESKADCCHSERSAAESQNLLLAVRPQGSETTIPLRRITTRPMKGTAPRGRTTAEDRTQANWLNSDPKNRAENVMIVDLLRNDLGRFCEFGTVRTSNLFAVERYPTLWQMTSTITGELRPEVTFQQIFRALFPCGSVTGAPKIRAMQLLSQLEQQPRGIYTGAIGFFSKHETVFNVAIRTLVLDGERGRMGVGSGIVIDSKPADEWRECLLKAEFLTRTPAHLFPDSFSLVETLLWRGNYPLIELHLDRLEDSADYFNFPFNRRQTKTVLEKHIADSLTCSSRAAGADSLSQTHALRKVRLLLNPDGSQQITSEPIATRSTKPLRIRIATELTDPQDPMYFHKTTHRPLYAQALNAATQAGYDEVLFLNQRREVTEGAIHSLVIEKNGHFLTPPIDCGLLPGVHRRHILESDPDAHEQVLTIEDLRQADAIYLCNAVRGLRPAIIDWETD